MPTEFFSKGYSYATLVYDPAMFWFFQIVCFQRCRYVNVFFMRRVFALHCFFVYLNVLLPLVDSFSSPHSKNVGLKDPSPSQSFVGLENEAKNPHSMKLLGT
jgi:hypothetical protein